MAGNANSGNRNGGKSITEIVQRAAKRAIKQGDHGLGGQRSLDNLLAETMQNDPLAFLKAIAPYVPREVILDQSVSITLALEEARSRLIDINSLQSAPLTLEHSDSAKLDDQPALLDAVIVSQGEV